MQSKAPTRSAGIAILGSLLGVLLVTPRSDRIRSSLRKPRLSQRPQRQPNPPLTQRVSPAAAQPGAVLDYEPTESISEDLSVSFPVDI